VAKILIADDDRLAARQMARTLRGAGHTVALARDGRAALQEAAERPDVILLDLGLPGLSGEVLLTQLKRHPDTAPISILVITGKREAAARLQASAPGWLADILLKPVSGPQLRQAVETALARHQERGMENPLEEIQERQGQLIQRLIVEGSDALVFQACRRLSSDRTRGRGSLSGNALSWTELSEWAQREGVLDEEQARLLRRIPETRPQVLRKGAA